jgi:hypothetical protein
VADHVLHFGDHFPGLKRLSALMDRVREFQAVHAARHLDIGEQQRDVRTRFEDGYSFVGIDGFDRRKAGILHHIDCAHAQQHLVFDDENDCENNGVIQYHHDGHFEVREKIGSRYGSQNGCLH